MKGVWCEMGVMDHLHLSIKIQVNFIRKMFNYTHFIQFTHLPGGHCQELKNYEMKIRWILKCVDYSEGCWKSMRVMEKICFSSQYFQILRRTRTNRRTKIPMKEYFWRTARTLLMFQYSLSISSWDLVLEPHWKEDRRWTWNFSHSWDFRDFAISKLFFGTNVNAGVLLGKIKSLWSLL